jgi:hypothetical protein
VDYKTKLSATKSEVFTLSNVANNVSSLSCTVLSVPSFAYS